MWSIWSISDQTNLINVSRSNQINLINMTNLMNVSRSDKTNLTNMSNLIRLTYVSIFDQINLINVSRTDQNWSNQCDQCEQNWSTPNQFDQCNWETIQKLANNPNPPFPLSPILPDKVKNKEWNLLFFLEKYFCTTLKKKYILGTTCHICHTTRCVGSIKHITAAETVR